MLTQFIEAKAEQFAGLGPDWRRLLASAVDSTTGGKRLRARFCEAGFLAVNPTPSPSQADGLARACAALEVLHASALVHDDFIDASQTRRGRPATHRAYAGEHVESGWAGDPDQYGAAAAILLGDLLLTWADELLRTCGLPAAQVSAAMDVFDECRTEVIAGQFLDVSVQARGQADVAEAMRVLRFKSAKYSVERPLHIGAALAGGGPAMLAALTEFGLPLGEAFQLRDDQLGVFGEPEQTGKPAGDDLVEGKRTVLVALALGRLDAAEADELDRGLGTDLNAEQVARLRDLLQTCGAADEVEDLIATLTDRALAALERAVHGAGLSTPAREALDALAEAATRRAH